MFEKHRKRRVIYNDDADQQYLEYGYEVTDEQSFIEARTTPTFNTHVDTYVSCLGNGCDPPYGGTHTIRPCLGSSAHATDLIVEACHRQGMEVWGSLRMNDLHDARRPEVSTDVPECCFDPLKLEHPEYMIAPPSVRALPPELSE